MHVYCGENEWATAAKNNIIKTEMHIKQIGIVCIKYSYMYVYKMLCLM